ncbi:hypothetical protein [Caulobacter henricii]|uniref:hypothetical protein n=1 Tax=Caulobacter henricii TaxID=69395 RepID=UPI0014125195|nr:hypothetical protein [Caulobacter henricii]
MQVRSFVAALMSTFSGLKALAQDERGLSSVEYATMGGVLSGATWLIGNAIFEASMVAVDRMSTANY